MADESDVTNAMSGAAGNVVQAAHVGEIHLHSGPRDPRPRQLPGAITKLVNQKRVLRQLDEALDAVGDDGPVVRVLRGQRGSGKSTVALHWLHGNAARFPDGQLYANLGAWTDQTSAPAEVLAGFLAGLGVDRSQIPADLESRTSMFRSLTHDRSFQILLDDAVTPAQVRSLLPGRGPSMVLVTGHGSFGTLLQSNAAQVDVQPLEDEMAIVLLRTFAGDRIDEEPTARDALVSMCAGLPSALCVVGVLLAESSHLALAELVDELNDPATGITSVTVGGEPSLGMVFDAGYSRLGRLAQRTYRVLGLHPHGDDVSVAALAVALGVPDASLRPVIRELHHLRMVDQHRAGRVTMHKLVHEHARSVAGAVEESSARLAVERAYVAWYVTGAITADAALLPQRPWRAEFFPGAIVDGSHPAAADAGAWMRAERTNLRSAVALAFKLGELESVLRLCVSQWWLFLAEKYADDLLATHARGLQAADGLGADVVKALLLVQEGFAHRGFGRFRDAITVCTEAIRLAESARRADLAATAQECAGLAAFDAGDVPQAVALLRRNLELAENIGDPRRIALACLHGAKPEAPERALVLLDRAYEGFRSLPVPEPQNLAKVLLWQGRKLGVEGGPRLREALSLATEHKHQADRAEVLEALAELENDVAVAVELYREALMIYEERGLVRSALAVQERLTDLN
ncbi:NB-ARC domain-containing protein [Lentzea sp. JNUCC 0626]|uniref:NB-ARC domain-containing protein n=1 Tax=Lentzea sp. JNUCC 0626 TaxID=3367513 RepID=UPI003748415B